MTSQSEHCGCGSNKHLEGFLRTRNGGESSTSSNTSSSDVNEVAHVMVTTSIFLVGLTFLLILNTSTRREIPLVFCILLVRPGVVIIFGKLKGMGSQGEKREEANGAHAA